jgi:Kef-type K+ transport system membrane component KefB
MDPLLQFLLVLTLIIVAAKVAGYLSMRLGQPAVVGKLVMGLVLGPTVLNLFRWPVFSDTHLQPMIIELAHLGVLFLMFVAGLEVDLGLMAASGRSTMLAGVLGVLTPIGLGLLVALPFGYTAQAGLFLGLVLAATSVSISAQTLMELGVLRTPVGIALLGAAVVDDVLVIVLLSLFTAVTGEGSGLLSVIVVVGKMLLVMAAIVLVGLRVVPPLAARAERLPISEAVLSVVFVVTLVFAWASEALGGMAAITGAFLAGVSFGRTSLRHTIDVKVRGLTYAWLVPIFFVSIGLQTDARLLGWAGVPFALAVIGVAIVAKVLGAGSGARLGGFANMDALRLGVGMVSRGEVGLIVASIGLKEGLLTTEAFTSLVIVVLVTTLVTPLLLRRLYPRPSAAHRGS